MLKNERKCVLRLSSSNGFPRILAFYLTPQRMFPTIEVFHTRDQNHVTAGANPFWGSSFAAAAVGAVDMLSN